MLKYIVASIFFSIFFFLIRKDKLYFIPMILIIYSNINGLLDWEDFALKGLIKFQDYGFVLVLILLFLDGFTLNRKIPEYSKSASRSSLFVIIQFYWFYYFMLFLMSIFIQGGPEWPIKMGRTFFYGLIFFLIYKKLLPNPILNFEKIFNCLMAFTILFSLLYASYNLLGWEIYPKGDQEVYEIAHNDNLVKRNFSGFPMFTGYFMFLFSNRLMEGIGLKMFNTIGLLLMMLCVFLVLTRGFILLVFALLLYIFFYRKLTKTNLLRIVGMIAIFPILLYLVTILSPGHYEALILRFTEFSNSGGMVESHNSVVRAKEFSNILKNVMDFNPLIGFGFTNVHALGYTSSQIHGGSADNGFSHLIGTTGFIGLLIFLILIFLWIRTNLKLQALKMEQYSKVNFVFILFLLGSFMNGSSMSYMHVYSLFLAYDLLAYSYFKKQKMLRLN